MTARLIVGRVKLMTPAGKAQPALVEGLRPFPGERRLAGLGRHGTKPDLGRRLPRPRPSTPPLGPRPCGTSSTSRHSQFPPAGRNATPMDGAFTINLDEAERPPYELPEDKGRTWPNRWDFGPASPPTASVAQPPPFDDDPRRNRVRKAILMRAVFQGVVLAESHDRGPIGMRPSWWCRWVAYACVDR